MLDEWKQNSIVKSLVIVRPLSESHSIDTCCMTLGNSVGRADLLFLSGERQKWGGRLTAKESLEAVNSFSRAMLDIYVKNIQML